MFPFWVFSSALLGLAVPASLSWFAKKDSIITAALSLIMVGMGMTLTTDDFLRVAKEPQKVLFGVLCQFVLMPLSALASGTFFKLPPSLFLGLTLVGTAPGGTASNLVTLIAGGDVALSVLMTGEPPSEPKRA